MGFGFTQSIGIAGGTGDAETIVGMPEKEGHDLIWELINHATRQLKFCFWECKWQGPGHLVICEMLRWRHGVDGEHEDRERSEMDKCI